MRHEEGLAMSSQAEDTPKNTPIGSPVDTPADDSAGEPQAPRSSLIPTSADLGFLNSSAPDSAGSPTEAPEPTWVEVCDASDVSVNGIYPYDVEREGAPYPIILVRTYGGLYALHDECPHRRVELSSEGYLDGQTLHCGWYHWGFSVETGEHTMPTGVCVARFEVKIESERVWIEV